MDMDAAAAAGRVAVGSHTTAKQGTSPHLASNLPDTRSTSPHLASNLPDTRSSRQCIMIQRRPTRLPTSNLGADFVSPVSSLFGRSHDQIIGGRIVRPPALKPMPLRRSDGHAHCDIRKTISGDRWHSVAISGNQLQSEAIRAHHHHLRRSAAGK